MLELHEKFSSAKSSIERKSLISDIAVTDQQIDRLVYELYDLTEEEISIVES